MAVAETASESFLSGFRKLAVSGSHQKGRSTAGDCPKREACTLAGREECESEDGGENEDAGMRTMA